jgi:hypothetical protein
MVRRSPDISLCIYNFLILILRKLTRLQYLLRKLFHHLLFLLSLLHHLFLFRTRLLFIHNRSLVLLFRQRSRLIHFSWPIIGQIFWLNIKLLDNILLFWRFWFIEVNIFWIGWLAYGSLLFAQRLMVWYWSRTLERFWFVASFCGGWWWKCMMVWYLDLNIWSDELLLVFTLWSWSRFRLPSFCLLFLI